MSEARSWTQASSTRPPPAAMTPSTSAARTSVVVTSTAQSRSKRCSPTITPPSAPLTRAMPVEAPTSAATTTVVARYSAGMWKALGAISPSTVDATSATPASGVKIASAVDATCGPVSWSPWLSLRAT